MNVRKPDHRGVTRVDGEIKEVWGVWKAPLLTEQEMLEIARDPYTMFRRPATEEGDET